MVDDLSMDPDFAHGRRGRLSRRGDWSKRRATRSQGAINQGLTPSTSPIRVGLPSSFVKGVDARPAELPGAPRTRTVEVVLLRL